MAKADWLHCNQCFRTEGLSMAVSSCGHIICKACCADTKRCRVCGANCNYLLISDKMKAQEKAYFSDPAKLIQSRLEHLSQVALFQSKQKERVTAYFKHKSVALEKRLKDAVEQSHRELSELRRENAELKKPLSQRRMSLGNFQSSSSNRMSRPVAITPPVTPGLRLHSDAPSGSGQSLERYRDNHQGNMTTPSSATSVSSLHSLRDPGIWTPISSTDPTHRPDSVTPNYFQFGSSSSLISPMLRRGSQHSGRPQREEVQFLIMQQNCMQKK